MMEMVSSFLLSLSSNVNSGNRTGSSILNSFLALLEIKSIELMNIYWPKQIFEEYFKQIMYSFIMVNNCCMLCILGNISTPFSLLGLNFILRIFFHSSFYFITKYKNVYF